MDRATAVLLSFRPKRSPLVDARLSSCSNKNHNSDSDNASDAANGQHGVSHVPHATDRRVLSECSHSSSFVSHALGGASPPPSPSPSPAAAAPPSTVTRFPEQVAFLTSVGEMVERLELKRGLGGDSDQNDGTHQGSEMGTLVQREEQAPPSLDTLVRKEGQCVRLRFVLSILSNRQKLLGLDTKTVEEEGRKKRKSDDDNKSNSCDSDASVMSSWYGAPASLTTILSCFEPQKPSYWQGDRLVEPYLGKSYFPITRRSHNGKIEENPCVDREEDGYNDLHDGSWYHDLNDIIGDRADLEGFGESDDTRAKRGGGDKAMRSYGKILTHHRCRNDPVFHDAFFWIQATSRMGRGARNVSCCHLTVPQSYPLSRRKY